MEIEQLEPPLPEDRIGELFALWEAAFDTSYEGFGGIMRGQEIEDNRDFVYLVRRDGEIAGTCHLTISRSQPALGGFGEVVTAPSFRRQGIAAAVCARARDSFRHLGGQALFLGTGNPEALRVYHRLGWRKLAGANVMALVTEDSSPEDFLADHFRQGGSVSVSPGTPAARVPMIPLIVSPHDWRVLDANVDLCSTRYKVQSSCMSLYHRYQALLQENCGTFFEARTENGCLVGLSTARLLEPSICQVDGFTHGSHTTIWNDLIEAAVDWGREQGADCIRALVAVEDEEKRAGFESPGFSEAGVGPDFSLDEREISSVKLEM